MAKYALDTNILIDALNVPAQLEALLGFLTWALPSTLLSAVVLHELAAGASSPRQRALLDQQITGPFARRGRVFAPSPKAWVQAGQVIQQGLPVTTPAALTDLLLALSCREAGMIVITRDRGFRRLPRVVRGLVVTTPFPAKPPTERA